ncbi:MAG: ATP-grasp domain-containing protein [Candidatus Thorarchaeota archaeon]
MEKKGNSVLIVGFNTRPLAYSLYKAGYIVYVVDFFGDLDLFPYIKDGSIIIKELGTSYKLIQKNYHRYLTEFTIKLLERNPKIDNLIIASGLDDQIEERNQILRIIRDRNYKIKNLNNDIINIKNARNIIEVNKLLKEKGYKVPITETFESINKIPPSITFPLIFKKRKSSGGINVYKIENKEKLIFLIKNLGRKEFKPSDWLIQEFIEGIPASCTTISNGNETKIISINRQVIGLDILNPPKDFMYCGNIVPGNFISRAKKLIAEISIALANRLRLKGINGFDFVLRRQYPYLMEINPRIPGSISASEHSMELNLIDLHIKSFNKNCWNEIVDILDNASYKKYATKLIYFAPKEVDINKITKVNHLKYIHDKTDPIKSIMQGEPICSILFIENSFANSFFGALKIADNITKILSLNY